MQLPTRTIRVKPGQEVEPFMDREWLVTNGLGGYAAGTIANIPTRRYHGLLIAALPAPFGRLMMLNYLSEQVRLHNGHTIRLGGMERPEGHLDVEGEEHLLGFRLEGGLPTWTFGVDGCVFEKQLFMVHEQNTVYVCYRLLQGDHPLRIKLRPAMQIRGHDHAVDHERPMHCALHVDEDRYEFVPPESSHFPPLRICLHGHTRALTVESRCLQSLLYRVEQRRGYGAVGELWSPGYFRATLTAEHPVSLVASTESWDTLLALQPDEALASTRERMERLLIDARDENPDPLADELVLAADQFMITPVGRAEERARARALGDEVRTVIAGYHWFTDWGRDTMISLEGLALVTGREAEAGFILRTFAHYVRDGLIPNMFPEGERDGLYHTADATLWFFHAVDRYLEYVEDDRTLRLLLPTLVAIYRAHLKGTRFGIGVDPSDGLLRQGADGYQLTWMDAKVGDWVVTPRRGKAVEINALWFNALQLLERWLRQDQQLKLADQVAESAAQAERSFNEKFFNSPESGLYDVIDGPQGHDAACRPNQIFAVSLPHPILRRERWETVVKVVQERLLTSVGLRSLSSDHPDYKKQYFGELRARDAAYHQGTVWGWLIGPFIDAWLRVYPERIAEARGFLKGFDHHLSESCVGSISEIFDAEDPFTPRGCVAQAWSVAEVLRAYCKTQGQRSGSKRRAAAPKHDVSMVAAKPSL